jgi:hypothetical protein
VQTTTLQLPHVTPFQPHLNQYVEHKNNIKNTRTASRTQKQLQENLQQLHQNATKRTNKVFPQANPSIDQVLPYFLQQISLNLIKNYSQNQRKTDCRRRASAKQRAGTSEEKAGRWRRMGASRGLHLVFSHVCHPVAPDALDKDLVTSGRPDAS